MTSLRTAHAVGSPAWRGGAHTYRRRTADGPPVEVHRAPIADKLPEVAALAAEGLNDRQIGALVGLSAAQVYGLRRRARPPIPAALPPGRPRGSVDRQPRITGHGFRVRRGAR